MGRHTDYSNYILRDNMTLIEENRKLKEELKSERLRNSLLVEENKWLKLQLEKDKIDKDKDCTCSSIPSSKCSFKKGISNNRKPSNKKVGGQKNHNGHCLAKSKIDILLENPNVKKINAKINYTDEVKDMEPVKRYKIGYEIIPIIYEYEIYPDKNGKYSIPKEFHSQVQYSNDFKTLAMDLYYERNVSTDNICSFFNNVFNFKISKGTIVNWEKELETNLMPETGYILRSLKAEKYDHFDDTQINVAGENYNVHNVSSNTHTMQWAHKCKGHTAIEEIGFLPQYTGIVIKDGTHNYDKYCKDFVSCGSHITRYLIGANKGIKHNGEERLLMFFYGLKRHRKQLIKKGFTSVSKNEYKDIVVQYEFLLEEWNKEIKADQKTNPCYDDERKLHARLLEDEKQHLRFMTNFSLPYTNNRAETDLRCVKQRQKVGIFRNYEAAERYVTIKSNLSTYKKNKVNVFEAIKSAFNKETIII